MNRIIESCKSLSFVQKVQMLRLVMLLQVLCFHLLSYFLSSFAELFYLEVWVGLSWVAVFVLIATEMFLDCLSLVET